MSEVGTIINSKVVNQFYMDIIHPSFERIGLSLGYFTGKIADRLDRLSDRICKDIPLENQVSPSANTLVPILKGIVYNEDGTILQEIFYNLLKNSIDKTREDLCHPAFPHILKQLSYDEIILLSIANKANNYNYKLGNDFDLYTITDTNFPKDKLKYKEQFNSYIYHLSDMSLIIGAKETIAAHSGRYDGGLNMLLYSIKLTPFGKQFMKSCMSDKTEELIKDLHLKT